MTRRWMGAAILAAIGIGPMTGSAVAAQRLTPPRHGLLIALRAVGVSAEQRQEIKTLVQQHQTEARPLIRQAAAARLALQEAVSAVPPDDAAVSTASANLAAVQAQAIATRARMTAQVFQRLTPDQQQKLQTLVARRKLILQRRNQR